MNHCEYCASNEHNFIMVHTGAKERSGQKSEQMIIRAESG